MNHFVKIFLSSSGLVIYNYPSISSFIIHSYLRQVLDETLRMSALAPYAARYSDHDITVGGYKVPAGTPIIHALGVSLKNETLWDKTNQ